MDVIDKIVEILMPADHYPEGATVFTKYGKKRREGIAAIIREELRQGDIEIQRSEFEDAGWRTITLSRGCVVFPDGRRSTFDVRLQALPGSEGEITFQAQTGTALRTWKMRKEKEKA